MTSSPEPADKSKGESESSLVQIRRNKRKEWADKGLAPYPTAAGAKPKHLAKKLHDDFDKFSKEELEPQQDQEFSVAGRVLLHRSFGKSTFMTLRDRSGRIQIFAQKSRLPEDVYKYIKTLDLGDVVYAKGHLFKTKTGELTIDASEFRLLSKNIRPLPEKFHGLSDVEIRYRKRYLDLICNDQVQNTFKIRSQIIQLIREFFIARDYLEVETPMLHPLAGGATARPFETFHNTLKMPLFCRIAPELYLKRLVVGGLDRVFEINRSFRNEGISIKHNPEFTMLEFYEAYATYEDLMTLTESLLQQVCEVLHQKKSISYQGEIISFEAPFRRFSVLESIREVGGLSQAEDEGALKEALQKAKAPLHGNESLQDLQWLAFEHLVEDKLVQPTFITDFPIAVSPLARRNEAQPEFAERFELFIAGREIANGFNELNDPDDQRSRFEDQMQRKAAGDKEANDYDEDYIEALEYGLPPTAGEGIGIDRLTMLFTDAASIRDVILFPLLRSQKSTTAEAEKDS